MSMENIDEEDEMTIFCKVTKTIGLKVKKSDTINNVKAKFRDEEGIPENLQEIFFAGNHLHNNQTLSDCGIKKNSTLNMIVNSSIRMQIFIKIQSTKKTLTLDVKPWDTIKNVKAIIHDKESLPAENQRLVYAGKILEDDQTLASSNILATSVLHLIVRPIDDLQIFIGLTDGRNLDLNVKTWYTVEDVKVMIESMLGTPPSAQQLVYAEEILIDSCTLVDYKISQGAVLHMTSLTMQIFIRTWEGKTITLEVTSFDTIKNVLTKIEKKLGLSLCQHHLVFSGKKLIDDQTLADYNIQKASTINLVVSPSSTVKHINVITPNHGVITLNVKLSFTINKIKGMVYEKVGIPPDTQILYFSGKEVCGQHTLGHHNIWMGSTLRLGLIPETRQKDVIE